MPRYALSTSWERCTALTVDPRVTQVVRMHPTALQKKHVCTKWKQSILEYTASIGSKCHGSSQIEIIAGNHVSVDITIFHLRVALCHREKGVSTEHENIAIVWIQKQRK